MDDLERGEPRGLGAAEHPGAAPQGAGPPRLRLRLPGAGQGSAELPFRLLLLGDFTGRPDEAPVAERRRYDLAGEGLAAAMRELGPRLSLVVPDRLTGEAGRTLRLTLKLGSLEAFGPDALVMEVPELAAALEQARRLGEGEARAELERRVGAQLDEVLHHERFQRLEAAWRGLALVLDRTAPGHNVRLDLLNVSKEDLGWDLEEVAAPSGSGLFEHVYGQAYERPGGEPFAAMIGDFELDHGPHDMRLLRSVAEVAARCQAPFIASAGASFFGVPSMADLSRLPDLAGLLECQLGHARWRALREAESARFVGLALPRLLLRLPYGRDTVPARALPYEEDVSAHHSLLWGNAAFAFAAVLSRSFERYGWAARVDGPGGLVENVPRLPVGCRGTLLGHSTEAEIERHPADTRGFELASLGFTLLEHVSPAGPAFHHAMSACRPARHTDPEASATSRAMAHLGNVFLVSRLAHHVKVLQRERIGATADRDLLQEELQTVVGTWVAPVQDAGPELQAACPLEAARVEVRECGMDPRLWDVELTVRPLHQPRGERCDLSIVIQLPRGQA